MLQGALLPLLEDLTEEHKWRYEQVRLWHTRIPKEDGRRAIQQMRRQSKTQTKRELLLESANCKSGRLTAKFDEAHWRRRVLKA